MLRKLEYTIKMMNKKIEEIQEELVSNKDNEVDATSTDSSKRRNFQEIPPQSRIIQK